MTYFKQYSGSEMDAIYRLLPENRWTDREDDYVGSLLQGAAVHYQRMRETFNEYHVRHAEEARLLKHIEAIDAVLALGYIDIWKRPWGKVSDAEVFQLGQKSAERLEKSDGSLWASPHYAEITRRTLESLRSLLCSNLDYVDPFVVGNRGRDADQRVPPPAANDKRPERRFIESLMEVFAKVHGIAATEIPIGNSADTNDFLRFARACVDPIAHRAFTDLSIRDHARAIRNKLKSVAD